MADNQKTLKAPVAFSGKGLHTGMESNMTVHPAPAGSGIVFRRTDLEGRPEIPALADYVTDTAQSCAPSNTSCRPSGRWASTMPSWRLTPPRHR